LASPTSAGSPAKSVVSVSFVQHVQPPPWQSISTALPFESVALHCALPLPTVQTGFAHDPSGGPFAPASGAAPPDEEDDDAGAGGLEGAGELDAGASLFGVGAPGVDPPVFCPVPPDWPDAAVE
jgi:hypothetical protein